MLHWALTAAAVLTFLYAIRILFVASKNSADGRETLGCGFSLVAALLWIYVLDGHLGQLVPAIRIALGLLLVLPAVQALADPARARILRALGGMVLGILVAGPVVRDLWQRHGPDTRPAGIRQAEERVREVRGLEVLLVDRFSILARVRDDVRAEIRGFDGGWEALESNPEALERLTLLHTVEQELAEVGAGLLKVRARLEALDRALASELESQLAVESWSLSGGDAEVERLRRLLAEKEGQGETGIVERHAQKMELRRLYEREF